MNLAIRICYSCYFKSGGHDTDNDGGKRVLLAGDDFGRTVFFCVECELNFPLPCVILHAHFSATRNGMRLQVSSPR